VAKRRRKPERSEPWDIRYFQRHRSDDPGRRAPAREFINGCPTGVRADIRATLKAVAEAPPPQFSGGGRWKAMHVSMKGYFEVRVMGPGRMLYRVFCLLEREAEGLDRPSIIPIDGMSKQSGTAFTEGEYAAVRRLGDEYRARTPRSVI
jgi:hypothetical protein